MLYRDQVTEPDREIWADADGCLYTAFWDENDQPCWYAFGASHAIYEDDPLVALPMYKVINGDGTFAVDKIGYSY